MEDGYGKGAKLKLAKYVANFIASISPRVYGVVGAGAMHLNDEICHHPGIQFIAMHHEQAAAMAAEADARVTNKISVVHVTAGPGGSNAITGVAGAYVDSIPMLVIAGQVTNATRNQHSLRQLGTNELDMVSMMKPVTKWAVTVEKAAYIRMTLEKAFDVAMAGRRGPVFVEIPLDVQAAEIDPEALIPHRPETIIKPAIGAKAIELAAQTIASARRPLILAGNGVRLSGAEYDLRRFVEATGIPVVTSWNGIDLFDSANDLVIGRPGIMGDRAGNFAIQNCDVLIVLGSRLSVPQTGHNQKDFAPDAFKIVVDIDGNELFKPVLRGGAAMTLRVTGDVGDFLHYLLAAMPWEAIGWRDPGAVAAWRERCLEWKRSYPVMLPEYRESKDGVNAYAFIEELGKHLDDDAIVVTDVGAAYIATHQSLKLNGRQRLFHSGGVSAMGVGIPMAIGAKLAGGKRQVVCLVGDGGAMVNIQELETIARYNLDIKIFVFCNDGYMTMQHTQKTHFGRESASSEESGFQTANFRYLTRGFGIEKELIAGSSHVGEIIEDVLASASPCLCEVNLVADQILAPRLMSKLNDRGEFVLPAFDDMWPHLPRNEYELVKSLVQNGSAAQWASEAATQAAE